MGKYIPVEPEKWAEMVKAMGVVKELNADIDRLRDRHGELCAENARLKAEVERLTPLLGDIVAFDEYHKLLQQVERLTKAGDAMANNLSHIGWQIGVDDWNDAKKGGQP
jgi:regulator of replication initiation timing